MPNASTNRFSDSLRSSRGKVRRHGRGRLIGRSLGWQEFADTFPLAAEDELVDFEVREILFKTRRGLVYRALFTIADRKVHILHIRGPGQNFLTAEEIELPR